MISLKIRDGGEEKILTVDGYFFTEYWTDCWEVKRLIEDAPTRDGIEIVEYRGAPVSKIVKGRCLDEVLDLIRKNGIEIDLL